MRNLITHQVDLRYTRQELRVLFALAVREDVERGGRYDARSSVIHVWSHVWLPHGMRETSVIMGALHCLWGEENRIYQIDTEGTCTLPRMLQELCVLELKALGCVKHGKCRLTPQPFIFPTHSW